MKESTKELIGYIIGILAILFTVGAIIYQLLK